MSSLTPSPIEEKPQSTEYSDEYDLQNFNYRSSKLSTIKSLDVKNLALKKSGRIF